MRTRAVRTIEVRPPRSRFASPSASASREAGARGTASYIGSCHAGAGNGAPRVQHWFFRYDWRQLARCILARSAFGRWAGRRAESGVQRLASNHCALTVQQRFRERYSAILEYAFECDLPPVNDPAYHEEWGEPRTVQRLYKLANTLAALIRNAKRRDAVSMERAINDSTGRRRLIIPSG